MTRIALILAMLVGAVAFPSPAWAERPVIGVLDVRVDGVPHEVANQFQKALEDQLDSKKYWLSPRAKMKERMASSTKWTDGCLVGGCLFDVKTQTGAQLVLIAALSGSGTSYGYVVTLLRTDVGSVVAQTSDRCDVCTVNEVMTNATLATIQLINALPEELPDGEAERHASVSLATGTLTKQLAQAKHAKRNGGVALIVGGIIAGGIGAALYLTKDKADYALATTAVGGGLLLGGVTILAF